MKTSFLFSIFIGSLVFGGSLVSAEKKMDKIGQMIYENTIGGKKEYLTFWGQGSDHSSFGIGHAIWYPAGAEKKCTEQFPALCTYLESRGINFPEWLNETEREKGAPWKTRDEFLADTKRVGELQVLLVATMALQAEYIVDRFNKKLPEIIEATPEEEKEKVKTHCSYLQATPLGNYALVDYCNFKGDGLNPKEESKGQRWGLLQVLQNMQEVTPENAPKAFVASAAVILAQLVQNSSPEYNRTKYLSGWMKRIATYANNKPFEE
ncbi:hypothetical protein K9K77_02355 [Candidatus Babeliales bacterium]|nr:hypothetical protein [Candidatus Babeliales bacterium]